MTPDELQQLARRLLDNHFFIVGPGRVRYQTEDEKAAWDLATGYLAEREKTIALSAQLEAAEKERDKWLDSFNRSEQFQDGWTKRAVAAEAELAAVELLKGDR